MKIVFSFIVVLLNFSAVLPAYTYIPESFNYQALARDASGAPIKNTTVSVKFTILRGPLPGTLVYSEKHSVTTDNNGVFSLAVGTGTVIDGIFSPGGWGLARHFLKVEIDPAGSDKYIDMGTIELLSVPYAFHANTVDNADDADADPSNELQELHLSGTLLSLSNGGGEVTLPTSGGGDNWGTQKVVSDNTLEGEGTSADPLKLASQKALRGQVLKWDGETWTPGNSSGGSTSWNDLEDIPKGFSDNVDNVKDDDDDPQNEIQDISLKGNSLSLSGDESPVDLSDFRCLWKQNEGDVYRSSGNVGIGTSNPLVSLHINAGKIEPNILLQNGSTGVSETDGLKIGRDSRGNFLFWNYEDTDIFFATNKKACLSIESSGDLKLENTEMHRTRSGDADLLPFAYGKIYNNGSIAHKSNNVSSASLEDTGTYKVNITGLGTVYIVILTPNIGGDYRITYTTADGYFNVYTRNGSGNLANTNFSFVVYKL